jgi:hypothetical protein
MAGPSQDPGAVSRTLPGSESYVKILANLGSVLAGVGAIAYVVATTGEKATKPANAPVAASAPSPVVFPPLAKPVEKKADELLPPAPEVPEPPKLDVAAVARGESALDAASRDRARAEARAEDASRRLEGASTRTAAEARNAKKLALRVRDPSTRITQAVANGGFVKAQKEALKKEIASIAHAPRPKAKVLSNKNPVARPSDGDEFHFEVRRNRVTFIDLDRLITQVKADAQLRIRMAQGARVLASKVGPVGSFSLEYSLARVLPTGFDDLMERRGIQYDLRAWEVVPEFEGRGETFEATRMAASDYARTIRRLNPGRSTVTMWVYPDGFALFRRLRDELQARGFLVAARPLPDGMAIRGSPSGSISAGQ